MSPISMDGDFDFDDPLELLEQIQYHRSWLKKIGESTIDYEMIDNLNAKIKALQQEMKPIDDEIEQLRRYLDRGIFDKISYRVALNDIHPKKANLEYEINKLRSVISESETRERRRQTYSKPALDFLNGINLKVYIYSEVTILLNGSRSVYLLVPDAVRQQAFELDMQLLATNSDLGQILLGEHVGKVATTDRRFLSLEIESISIASDDILYFLGGIYQSTKTSRSIQIKNRHLGNSVQRWRDGARSDSYVFCNRCYSLYPFGSTCNC